MAKVKHVTNQDGLHYGYGFTCPGCGDWHVIPTKHSRKDVNWTFNDNLDKPTFSPSLLVSWVVPKEMKNSGFKHICHSFIRDGKIQFLGDCTHNKANQTVDLEDIVDYGKEVNV